MINRRDFGKLVLGATALSFTACNSLASGLSTIPANKKRVVIVGGGFGGAATARYLRKFDSNVEIVLVEQNKEYYTCPFSNAVIAGMEKMDFIKPSSPYFSKISVADFFVKPLIILVRKKNSSCSFT